MKKILNFIFSFWGILVLFALTRISIYIGNPVPTGYDAGIYLHIMKTFPALDTWLRSGFSPGVFVLTYPFVRLGISPESLLIPLSLLSQLFLFLSLYITVSQVAGRKATLFSAFLFAVSPVQFRMFWYFYVKNTFGLSFLLLTLAAVSKRSLVWAIIFGALVALFHLPTFLILALVLAVELLISKNSRVFFLQTTVGITVLSGIYYIAHFHEAIEPFLLPLLRSTLLMRVAADTLSQTVYGGAFYTIGQSIPLMLLSLPLAFYTIFLFGKGKLMQYRTLLIAFVITLLIVITQFSFYQRFIIPLDLFAVCLAGAALTYLSDTYSKNKDAVDLLKFYFCVCTIVIIAFILKTGKPLITPSELTEIKSFKVGEQAYILSIAKEDPAWILGYTPYPVIAWAFGGYDKYWTDSQWEKFFAASTVSEERKKLLTLLPSPLYIYINDKTKASFNDTDACFSRVSPHFYFFHCQ